MPLTSNENQLKRCLDATVEAIKNTMRALPSAISESDTTSMNSFTLNVEDDEVMDELKSSIERILNEHLPRLTDDFRNYVESFLSQYDYDDKRKQFKNGLTVGILQPLRRGLQGLSESIIALNAAWDGTIAIVQQFIENYPSLKDKPGHFGTTLLYSAARNGHLKLVKYLIETAKCSVNAQNEQDLGHSLKSSKTTSHDYEARSKAASTALHAACFNGRQDIVEYLIEHGANYFMRNQASETPIMNIKDEKITQYFRNHLLLGYIKPQRHLPDKPILEDTRPILDCIWEYKSLNNDEWKPYSSGRIGRIGGIAKNR